MYRVCRWCCSFLGELAVQRSAPESQNDTQSVFYRQYSTFAHPAIGKDDDSFHTMGVQISFIIHLELTRQEKSYESL
jgi:hypothetical protein